MSGEAKAPQPILDQILEDMFQKLEEEDLFNIETLIELRNLADTNSLIKGDKLRDLLKESVIANEDPRVRD